MCACENAVFYEMKRIDFVFLFVNLLSRSKKLKHLPCGLSYYITEKKKKKAPETFSGKIPKSGNPCRSAFWGIKWFQILFRLWDWPAVYLWASCFPSLSLYFLIGSRLWWVMWHSSWLCEWRGLAGNRHGWVSEFSRTFATGLRSRKGKDLGNIIFPLLSVCKCFRCLLTQGIFRSS